MARLVNFENYHRSRLEEFSRYIEAGNRLCELEISFRGGDTPDYSNPHVQELYELRYSYAYAFDYIRIYRKVVNDLLQEGKTEEVKVISLGCGNMIDYWSLANAIMEKEAETRIIYYGIDAIDWNYKFSWRDGDQRWFRQEDFLAVLEDIHLLNPDIIIFPMSLSELDDDSYIDTLADKIAGIMKDKDRVYLAARIRSTDSDSQEIDTRKLRRIADNMIRSGYQKEGIGLDPVNPSDPDDREIPRKNNHLFLVDDAKKLLDNLCRSCRADCDHRNKCVGNDCKAYKKDKCTLKPKMMLNTENDTCVIYKFRIAGYHINEELPF